MKAATAIDFVICSILSRIIRVFSCCQTRVHQGELEEIPHIEKERKWGKINKPRQKKVIYFFKSPFLSFPLPQCIPQNFTLDHTHYYDYQLMKKMYIHSWEIHLPPPRPSQPKYHTLDPPFYVAPHIPSQKSVDLFQKKSKKVTIFLEKLKKCGECGRIFWKFSTIFETLWEICGKLRQK